MSAKDCESPIEYLNPTSTVRERNIA